MASDVDSLRRKMDILNGDLQLKNDAKAKKRGEKSTNSAEDESVAGFHFIAFVPINGRVWKLDGLERQPQNSGESSFSRLNEVTSVLINAVFIRCHRKPRLGVPGEA